MSKPLKASIMQGICFMDRVQDCHTRMTPMDVLQQQHLHKLCGEEVSWR